MAENLHFIVYTLEFCPNCERLKAVSYTHLRAHET